MSDYYALSHEEVIKTAYCVPRREFDLVEFYKVLKNDKRFRIIGVEFDINRHMIIFHVIKIHGIKLEK